MPRLWARTVSFDSVSLGDQLPILVKWETEETIKRFNALVSGAPEDANGSSKPQDPQTPEGATASSAALLAYVAELLEKGFPIASILAQGSSLDLEVLQTVGPGDTLVLTGRVVGKQEVQDKRVVECEVVIDNQDGQTVARARATVCL